MLRRWKIRQAGGGEADGELAPKVPVAGHDPDARVDVVLPDDPQSVDPFQRGPDRGWITVATDFHAELLGRHARGQLGHGALLDHPAADEDADAAADAFDLQQEVARQEDGHAILVGQGPDEAEQLVGTDRVDGRRRFVEDDDARLGQ